MHAQPQRVMGGVPLIWQRVMGGARVCIAMGITEVGMGTGGVMEASGVRSSELVARGLAVQRDTSRGWSSRVWTHHAWP